MRVLSFKTKQQLKINPFPPFPCTSLPAVYIPCRFDSAYSSPFMAFTWLLLKRANPNSWENTEQEMALHLETSEKQHFAYSLLSPFLWGIQVNLACSTTNNNTRLTYFWPPFPFSTQISHFFILAFSRRLPRLCCPCYCLTYKSYQTLENAFGMSACMIESNVSR